MRKKKEKGDAREIGNGVKGWRLSRGGGETVWYTTELWEEVARAYTQTPVHTRPPPIQVTRGCTQAQFRGLNGAAACSTSEWRSRNVVPRLSSTWEHRRFERAATFSPSRRARRVPGGVRGRSTRERGPTSRGPLLRTLTWNYAATP